MPAGIEPLESRTLYSASPASVALGAAMKTLVRDSAAVRVAVNHAASALPRQLQGIHAALRQSPSDQNTQLFLALAGDAKSHVLTLRQELQVLTKVAQGEFHRDVADVLRLQRKPGDPTLTARVTSEINQLQNDIGSLHLDTDLIAFQTAIDQDVAALASANPTNTALQTRVAAAQSGSNDAVAAIESAYATLQNDGASFLSDLAAEL